MDKAQILSQDDRQYENVEVPEWGCTLRVGSIGLQDRLEIEALASASDNPERQAAFQATVVQRCTYNGDGCLLFSPEDVSALAAKNPVAIARLFGVAIRLNRMRAEDAEEMQRLFFGSR